MLARAIENFFMIRLVCIDLIKQNFNAKCPAK
jgi:hypothetical protein